MNRDQNAHSAGRKGASDLGSPHPKSLSQFWERDFEHGFLLPFSQYWEKGLGDEGDSKTEVQLVEKPPYSFTNHLGLLYGGFGALRFANTPYR
jgi:hypothetical protein